MRTPARFLGLLTLILAGCGSHDPRHAGLEALQKGDYKVAAAELAKVSGAEGDMEVLMARCSALAHVDAAKAVAEFEALISADKAKPADFSTVVGHLLGAGQFASAVSVMDKGIKKYPEDPKMIGLRDKVVQESQKDPEGNNALKGLGYLGD